ncbi:hypothetical protein Tco_1570472 [Tanacetum coccineum]
MQNLEDSSDPTTAMNKALALLAKAFKVQYHTTNNTNEVREYQGSTNVCSIMGMSLRQNAVNPGGSLCQQLHSKAKETGMRLSQPAQLLKKKKQDLKHSSEVNHGCWQMLMKKLRDKSDKLHFRGYIADKHPYLDLKADNAPSMTHEDNTEVPNDENCNYNDKSTCILTSAVY